MPDMWMDVDVALSEVPVNILPLIDDTDFKTREIGITYNQAGMDLVWNFTTTAGATTQTAVTPTTGGAYDWAHQGDGMYTIEIPDSAGGSINNDTEGFGWFTGYCTGVLPWRGPIIGFRAAALNNALIDGGDELDVNVTKVSDTAQTANDNGADINTILTNVDLLGKRVTLTGTASAGSATTITLTGGVATNGYYDGQLVIITGGTGIGQARTILSYVGGTTVATVTRDWAVAPDNTSTFNIIGADIPAILEAGTAQAGAAATITLDSGASAVNDIYNDNFIMITAGTGIGQARVIADYNGGTKVAIVNPAWTTQPDATSVYQVLPQGRVHVAGWGGAGVSLSTGDLPNVNVKEISDDATAANNLELACDNYSVTRGLSGTALPNAAADAAGGLPISDLGGLDLDAQIGTDIDAILTDTTEIGAAGVGLTAVPWNAAWDAEVQSECADALTAYDPPTNTEMVSAFTEIKGATWASGTDTLEHIRNKQTDLETDTQDLQTQIGTAGIGLTAVPWNASWDAEVQSECTDALNAYDPPTKAEMDTGHGLLATEAKQDTIDTVVDAIKAVTDNLPDSGALTTLLSNVAAILADTGTDGVVVASGSKTGYALSAAGVDAIADEEYDNDGTAISLRGAIKLILSVLTAKSSGGGGSTIIFRDINDSKSRISATVDANGNRTAVGTRDAT